MSFPEYMKKSNLVGLILKLSDQPPIRTPKGLFELYLKTFEKPTVPDAITNEEGYISKKDIVVLATLQDVSWIYHKRTTKYFTAVTDPKNPAWCNFADIS